MLRLHVAARLTGTGGIIHYLSLYQPGTGDWGRWSVRSDDAHAAKESAVLASVTTN